MKLRDTARSKDHVRYASYGLALIVTAWAPPSTLAVQEGDIVFHTSRSSQSLAIQKATHSPYSHMGLILYRRGTPYVFEAIGTVQYTPLRRWVNRGSGSRYVVKRLKQAPTLLTTEAIGKLHAAARVFEGKRYDPTFEWSDDKIYCSELVWKIYERALGIRVGELQRLRDFDLSDPAVKAKMRQRYGRRVPLDEIVISPAAMYEWTGLGVVTDE